MSPRILIAAFFVLSIASITVTAGQEEAVLSTNPVIGTENLETLHATVTAVDLDAREITVADAEDNSLTLTLGEDVKNLPQVVVGDQFDLAYYELVTFEVLSPGEAKPALAAGSAMETAKPGDKPAASAIGEVAAVAEVTAIDKVANTVDLKGPAGNTRTVAVSNPENLDKVEVGDELLITVTKAVAVSVTAAQSGE
jgi:hypothetical protein